MDFALNSFSFLAEFVNFHITHLGQILLQSVLTPQLCICIIICSAIWNSTVRVYGFFQENIEKTKWVFFLPNRYVCSLEYVRL